MDAGSDHGSAAKGSAIDLKVADSGLVSWYIVTMAQPDSCCFSFLSSFFTMCGLLPCGITMVRRPSPLGLSVTHFTSALHLIKSS